MDGLTPVLSRVELAEEKMLLERRERRLCPPSSLLYSVGGSVDSYRYQQGRNEHGRKVRGWFCVE